MTIKEFVEQMTDQRIKEAEPHRCSKYVKCEYKPHFKLQFSLYVKVLKGPLMKRILHHHKNGAVTLQASWLSPSQIIISNTPY